MPPNQGVFNERDCFKCANHGSFVPISRLHLKQCPHEHCECPRCTGDLHELHHSAVVKLCTLCLNHGLQKSIGPKHKKLCMYFTCLCSKCCKSELTLPNSVKVVRDRLVALKLKERQEWESTYQGAHEVQCETSDTPHQHHQRAVERICALCINHGIRRPIGQGHKKECLYFTCECTKCCESAETLPPSLKQARKRAISRKLAEERKNEVYKDALSLQSGMSDTPYVEQQHVEKPCVFCENHGVQGPASRKHLKGFCTYYTCECSICCDSAQKLPAFLTIARERAIYRKHGEEYECEDTYEDAVALECEMSDTSHLGQQRAVKKPCLFCRNHGFLAPLGRKHKGECMHFTCECSKCCDSANVLPTYVKEVRDKAISLKLAEEHKWEGECEDSNERQSGTSDVPHELHTQANGKPCTLCQNHGFLIPRGKRHKKKCKFFACECNECCDSAEFLPLAIKLARGEAIALKQAQKQNREDTTASKVHSGSGDDSSRPLCPKCRNHGLLRSIGLKHTKKCMYQTCKCTKCCDSVKEKSTSKDVRDEGIPLKPARQQVDGATKETLVTSSEETPDRATSTKPEVQQGDSDSKKTLSTSSKEARAKATIPESAQKQQDGNSKATLVIASQNAPDGGNSSKPTHKQKHFDSEKEPRVRVVLPKAANERKVAESGSGCKTKSVTALKSNGSVYFGPGRSPSPLTSKDLERCIFCLNHGLIVSFAHKHVDICTFRHCKCTICMLASTRLKRGTKQTDPKEACTKAIPTKPVRRQKVSASGSGCNTPSVTESKTNGSVFFGPGLSPAPLNSGDLERCIFCLNHSQNVLFTPGHMDTCAFLHCKCTMCMLSATRLKGLSEQRVQSKSCDASISQKPAQELKVTASWSGCKAQSAPAAVETEDVSKQSECPTERSEVREDVEELTEVSDLKCDSVDSQVGATGEDIESNLERAALHSTPDDNTSPADRSEKYTTSVSVVPGTVSSGYESQELSCDADPGDDTPGTPDVSEVADAPQRPTSHPEENPNQDGDSTGQSQEVAEAPQLPISHSEVNPNQDGDSAGQSQEDNACGPTDHSEYVTHAARRMTGHPEKGASAVQSSDKPIVSNEQLQPNTEQDSLVPGDFSTSRDCELQHQDDTVAVTRAGSSVREDSAGSPKLPIEDSAGSPKLPIEDSAGSPKLPIEDSAGSPKLPIEDSSGSPKLPNRDLLEVHDNCINGTTASKENCLPQTSPVTHSKRSTLVCSLCRNHSSQVRMKGHNNCPYRTCECDKCQRTRVVRLVKAKSKLRSAAKRAGSKLKVSKSKTLSCRPSKLAKTLKEKANINRPTFKSKADKAPRYRRSGTDRERHKRRAREESCRSPTIGSSSVTRGDCDIISNHIQSDSAGASRDGGEFDEPGDAVGVGLQGLSAAPSDCEFSHLKDRSSEDSSEADPQVAEEAFLVGCMWCEEEFSSDDLLASHCLTHAEAGPIQDDPGSNDAVEDSRCKDNVDAVCPPKIAVLSIKCSIDLARISFPVRRKSKVYGDSIRTSRKEGVATNPVRSERNYLTKKQGSSVDDRAQPPEARISVNGTDAGSDDGVLHLAEGETLLAELPSSSGSEISELEFVLEDSNITVPEETRKEPRRASSQGSASQSATPAVSEPSQVVPEGSRLSEVKSTEVSRCEVVDPGKAPGTKHASDSEAKRREDSSPSSRVIQKPKYGRMLHPCSECQLKSTTRKRLARHRIADHALPSVRTCQVCRTALQSPFAHEVHMNTAHTACPVQCPECGARFPSALLRDVHQYDTHGSREAAFKCPTDSCDASADSPSALTLHVRQAHRATTPFGCSFCGSSFDCVGSLAVHHGAHLEALSRDGRCEFCCAWFPSTEMLRLHLAEAHNEDHPYSCPQPRCEKKFKRAKGQTLHVAAKHAVALVFRCEHCDAGCRSLADLQKHLQDSGHLPFAYADRLFCRPCGLATHDHLLMRDHVDGEAHTGLVSLERASQLFTLMKDAVVIS